jgi:hypothetical protein
MSRSASVLPQSEELLMGGPGSGAGALHCVGAAELKARERTQGAIHGDAAVVQELLELQFCFLALAQQ